MNNSPLEYADCYLRQIIYDYYYFKCNEKLTALNIETARFRSIDKATRDSTEPLLPSSEQNCENFREHYNVIRN